MGKPEYFDYEKVAREEHVSKVVLRKIEKEVRKDFPLDKMMYRGEGSGLEC